MRVPAADRDRAPSAPRVMGVMSCTHSCVVAGRVRSCAALSRVRFQFTSGRGGAGRPQRGRGHPAWAKRHRVYPTCSTRSMYWRLAARPRLLIKLNLFQTSCFSCFIQARFQMRQLCRRLEHQTQCCSLMCHLEFICLLNFKAPRSAAKYVKFRRLLFCFFL